MFIDILMPIAIFSTAMLSDELDILVALTSLLQTLKEIDKLKSLPLAQWPVYSTTMKKIKQENGEREYQCQSLKRFDEAEAFSFITMQSFAPG